MLMVPYRETTHPTPLADRAEIHIFPTRYAVFHLFFSVCLKNVVTNLIFHMLRISWFWCI
jgi:hypothetical protein